MSIKLSICRLWGSRVLPGTTFLLCGVLAVPTSASPSENASEIVKLIHRGQLNEAMQQVDHALLTNPANSQMRFSKGVILAQQGKSAEAIALLVKLTEDYPRLSEPYNNLAVLYASNGQYENARIALGKATANKPDYGMAYENLGDVYAELASQAYAKAAKLDDGANARVKLAALRGSRQSTSGLAKPGAVSAKGALAVADNTATTSRLALDRKAGSQKFAGKDAAEPKQAAVLNAVKAWADAWSARNVSAYLAAYSSDFVTPHGMRHHKWVAERTERITSKQRIVVKVEAPKVTLNGDQATVQFRQQFISDKLRSTDQKTLMLIRRDGAWRIREERVG